MTSPDNILLHLPPEQTQQIRDIYAELALRGFPQQNQTPHITITFSPHMCAEALECAAELLPQVIPATFSRRGMVVFGTKRKQTVAWLLETSDELEVASRKISEKNPDGRGARWIPHLTMGLRLQKEDVPGYMRALDEVTPTRFNELHATRAALWRPRTQELTVLAGDLG